MGSEPRVSRIIKTIARELSSMAFTLAGSVIVVATLSGQTRKIAMIATGSALVLHLIHIVTRHDEV
jgi:hypothetical protein